jgi:hypothetical protein
MGFHPKAQSPDFDYHGQGELEYCVVGESSANLQAMM